MLLVRKLHLMSDRRIVATEDVVGEVSIHFCNLMDKLIEDLDSYIPDGFDTNDDVRSVMRYAAEKAKRHPPELSDICSFHTGDPAQPHAIYSIVIQGCPVWPNQDA